MCCQICSDGYWSLPAATTDGILTPVQHLSKSIFAELVSGHIGVQPNAVRLEPCATGKHNQTWFVGGDGPPLVLRVAPPDDPATGVGRWQISDGKWAAVGANNVPGSGIYVMCHCYLFTRPVEVNGLIGAREMPIPEIWNN